MSVAVEETKINLNVEKCCKDAPTVRMVLQGLKEADEGNVLECSLATSLFVGM